MREAEDDDGRLTTHLSGADRVPEALCAIAYIRLMLMDGGGALDRTRRRSFGWVIR